MPMDFNACVTFCLHAGQTRSDGARTGTGGRDGARAARTEGGEGDAPREEGDHAECSETRRHQIQQWFIRAEETPSGAHACIYTTMSNNAYTIYNRAGGGLKSRKVQPREPCSERAGALNREQVAASTLPH